MKITPISNFIAFKSHIKDDENILGFDDDISGERRNFIREHYYEYKMPYQSIYENEGRKTEYQMQVLLNSLLGKPRKIDEETLMGLNIPNLQSIGENSYRGASLVGKPNYLKILKNAGIERIIDLCGYSFYKNEANEAGLDYLNFNMKTSDAYFQNIWHHSVFQNNVCKNDRSFINNFVKFIQTMQKGFCYIGCEFGTTDTSDALLLYNVFSPKTKSGLPDDIDETKFDPIRALYDKLTDDDKMLMGWTDEFDKNFLPRLKKAEEPFLKAQEDELSAWLLKKFGTDNLQEIEEIIKKMKR